LEVLRWHERGMQRARARSTARRVGPSASAHRLTPSGGPSHRDRHWQWPVAASLPVTPSRSGGTGQGLPQWQPEPGRPTPGAVRPSRAGPIIPRAPASPARRPGPGRARPGLLEKAPARAS
jgi:hypothetical protein